MAGGLYEFEGKFIGIEYLAVEEDAFNGRQGGADEEVYFIRQIFYLFVVLR